MLLAVAFAAQILLVPVKMWVMQQMLNLTFPVGNTLLLATLLRFFADQINNKMVGSATHIATVALMV